MLKRTASPKALYQEKAWWVPGTDRKLCGWAKGESSTSQWCLFLFPWLPPFLSRNLLNISRSHAIPTSWTCPDWASPLDYCVPRPWHPLHLETGTWKVAVMYYFLGLSNFSLVTLLALLNLILSLKHLMFLMCPSQKLYTGHHKCCKNSLCF